MSIQLSEEAFTLPYFLRERLDRMHELIDSGPARAKGELAEANAELAEWIGPGVL